MNSYTTEQLLMCEKGDLVKFIEELKEECDEADDFEKEIKEENKKLKEQVKGYENIKTHDTLAFFNPRAAKLYEELKEQLNTIFPSKTEQAVISKYQVQRTNNLRIIKKLKDEINKLEEQKAPPDRDWET